MKKASLFAAGLLLAANTFAQSWSVDKAHSFVCFSVTHLKIADVQGNFTKFDGKISDAGKDFNGAKIEFSAETASINTSVEGRDKHLKSADFFDADKNPSISFTSKSFKKESGKKYKVTGDLTMHGVTKQVTLDATLNGTTVHPMNKKDLVGFTVTGDVKRTDFGIATSTGEAMLSDVVKLKANLEFTKD